MKINRLLLAIMVIQIVGAMYSQNIPDSLFLSGSQTGDNHYDAVNILSTQSIESDKTTYSASNTITLKPGFHAKTGSEFRVLSRRRYLCKIQRDTQLRPSAYQLYVA